MWDVGSDMVGAWEFTPYGAPYHVNGRVGFTQLYTGHDLDPVRPVRRVHPFRLLHPALR